MKNIKVLGLAIAASLVAAPVFAGETYVRNEWTNTDSHTYTNLHLDSTTKSYRNEYYDSYADKTYKEGSVKDSLVIDPKTKTVSFTTDYDGYSVHEAGSGLWGNFSEYIYTNVYGSINSYAASYSEAHETSSGVR